jgi:hypothetical protein
MRELEPIQRSPRGMGIGYGLIGRRDESSPLRVNKRVNKVSARRSLARVISSRARSVPARLRRVGSSRAKPAVDRKTATTPATGEGQAITSFVPGDTGHLGGFSRIMGRPLKTAVHRLWWKSDPHPVGMGGGIAIHQKRPS